MGLYRPARIVLLLCCALALPATARAWAPATHAAIAREARRLAPPDLARQLEKNRLAFEAGASQATSEHFDGPDGDQLLRQAIGAASRDAIAAIEDFRPFEEIAFRLGTLSYYLADANAPLQAAATDPMEDRYRADFERYLAQTEPRLPLLFYGVLPGLHQSGSLDPVVDQALERSRRLYDTVGREYRRIEFGSGVRLFDDRSSAFGAAALAFNHAVTDVTQGLIWVWVRGGGHDPRNGLPERGRKVLRLPRAAEAEARDARRP